MATQWFYRVGEREFGPLGSGEIRGLAKNGTIEPNTLVRREDSDWMKAGRIKGLFAYRLQINAEQDDDVAVDPLIVVGEQVVFSFTATANIAASAVGGFFSRRSERKDESSAKSAQDGGLIAKFTLDNQSPEVVAKVIEKLNGILMAGEQLAYVAVQNKPIVNWAPDCVALTNKRFVFFRPKMLGRVDFEDFVWRDLRDAKLSENMIGSTFTVRTADGKTLSMDYLPKAQARALYRFAQEMEERSLEERRTRGLEEKRAAAGGVTVQTVSAQPFHQVEADDPVATLKKLKGLLDADLISVAEFETKKAEILARM